ncbi:MAG: HIT domain-containing protein [Candidatus Woesearchaeota archaeon]|jgi:histidine triad (HIT) family protein
MDEAEYQKQMEEVKKNCPFCKIVKGEIPSTKVYEDEFVLAILDIHPLRKGHTLVLPKEHYPVLPLLPPELYRKLFLVVDKLSFACAKATLNPYSNIFVANGALAGQQSHHCMVHVIPNENKGGFDIPNKVSHDDKNLAANIDSFSKNLSLQIRNHLVKNPSFIPHSVLKPDNDKIAKSHIESQLSNNHVSQSMSPPSVFANLDVNQIVDLILSNKEVLDVLLSDSNKFKQMVPTHPQLSVIFSKISVDDVISKIKEKVGSKTSVTQNSSNVNLDNMKIDDVVSIVMNNKLVRDALLFDPLKFKTLIPQNETLKKLFANVSSDEVYTKIKEKIAKGEM